jgi:type II secretory pathway pseudopilin PulG
MAMKKSEKGIGLIEIIIAMLIFGIGISAAIRTLPVSNKAASRARNLTMATNLAQEKIEELMSIPYASADLSAGGHVDPDNPLDRIFTRTWNVTDNTPLTDMKQIDVTVSYDTDNPDNAVTLTTYITSRR